MTYDEKTGMTELGVEIEDLKVASGMLNIGDQVLWRDVWVEGDAVLREGKLILISVQNHSYDNNCLYTVWWNNMFCATDTIQIPAPTLPDLLERAKSEPVVFRFLYNSDDNSDHYMLAPDFYDHDLICFNEYLKRSDKIETQLAQGVWVPVNTQKKGGEG